MCVSNLPYQLVDTLDGTLPPRTGARRWGAEQGSSEEEDEDEQGSSEAPSSLLGRHPPSNAPPPAPRRRNLGGRARELLMGDEDEEHGLSKKKLLFEDDDDDTLALHEDLHGADGNENDAGAGGEHDGRRNSGDEDDGVLPWLSADEELLLSERGEDDGGESSFRAGPRREVGFSNRLINPRDGSAFSYRRGTGANAGGTGANADGLILNIEGGPFRTSSTSSSQSSSFSMWSW